MYAKRRSAVYELQCGTVDGKYKRYRPNTGGVVEDTTVPFRHEMSGVWHGFAEVRTKILPDGRLHVSREHYNIEPVDRENV